MLPLNASMLSRRAARGYTLVEMLMVVALMGIFAALLLPRFEPSVHDQLQGAASIISADLSYTRNLAVTNDSTYMLKFSRGDNAYALTHSGSNNLLDVLPTTPYRHAESAPDLQMTYMEDLPHLGPAVEIYGVQVGSTAVSASGWVEFNGLGGVEGAKTFTVWLACGNGDTRRYQSLTVAPVTGLVSVGAFRANAP